MFGGALVGKRIAAVAVDGDDLRRLAVGYDPHELGDVLEPLRGNPVVVHRPGDAQRTAVAPGRVEGEGDGGDQQKKHHEQIAEAGIGGRQGFVAGDRPNHEPWRRGDAARRDQDRLTRIVPLDGETAGFVRGEDGRELWGVDGQGAAERRGAIGQRRQVLDGKIVGAHQVGFGGSAGLSGLNQAVEQGAVHDAKPDDGADSLGAVSLHREHRQHEAQGRQAAGADVHVDDRRIAAHRLGHRAADAVADGRHARRGDDRTSVRVDETQSGDAHSLDVGRDLSGGRRRREAGLIGRRHQEIAQVTGLRRFVGHGGAVSARLEQFRQVELKRRVFRQVPQGAECAI